MPYNGSGTFTPTDSGVTAGTTAAASEMNNILDDIWDGLTAAFAKDGQSVMTGQMKAANGSAAAPAITFGSDLDSGFYRISANTIGFAVGGALVFTLDSTGITLASGKTLGSTANIITTANIVDNAVTLAKMATIADATILANTTGGASIPVATTLTAILDDMMGSTRGNMLRRGASSWGALGVGTNGYILKSDGTDFNWYAATDIGLPSQSGNSGKYLTTNGTSSSWTSAPLFCRAAVTLSGGTPTVQSSSNLASVAKQSTGVFRFTFNTAASSAGSYTVIGNGYDSTYSGVTCYLPASDRTTGYFDLRVSVPTIGNVDPETLEVAVFGG